MKNIIYLIFFSFNVLSGYNAHSYMSKYIYVHDYGAVGDGETNDTYSISKALEAAVLNNAILVFDSKTYAVDSVYASGAKNKSIPKLTIQGNSATLKCVSKAGNNTVSFYFIDMLEVSRLIIIGNKTYQSNGNGIGVYYSKNVKIEDCEFSNCKYSGLIIAWTMNALITGNKIHNNGDGALPSDGITIHSLQSGEIKNNLIYENNPEPNQDGDGIHISQISYAIPGFYNPQDVGNIEVKANVCYNHGRRGVKVQRSKVTVENNILFNNMMGVQIARNELIKDILLQGNSIVSCKKGICTDGAKQINIQDLIIQDNEIVYTKPGLGIEIVDSKSTNVLYNDFHSLLENQAITDVNINQGVKDVNVKSSHKIMIDGSQNLSSISYEDSTGRSEAETIPNICWLEEYATDQSISNKVCNQQIPVMIIEKTLNAKARERILVDIHCETNKSINEKVTYERGHIIILMPFEDNIEVYNVALQ